MPRTTASRVRAAIGTAALAAAFLLPGAGTAGAQVVPPLPVLPGLPANVPGNSTGTAIGAMAPDLDLEILSTATQDPTALSVAPDGRVVFAERQGAIKVITTAGVTKEAGRILTSATACVGCPDQSLEEGGIHGLELAADFADTGRFYAYYSVPFSVGTSGFAPNEGAFRLSSFVLTDANVVEMSSERVLMTNPAEWFTCCHYGGDIDLMPDGTLLLSVGDDASPRVEQYNPRDNRPGFEAHNAERTSQNRLDRRGKVLRLMPDGSVPTAAKGVAPNPHAGDPTYDPYVYAMGFRSDYRIAVDQATGFTFVGNVGPDAGSDDVNRGPRGHDELETIRPGGGSNHGWPRCIGNNTPFKAFDYVTQTSGAPLSCEGMTPANIWYPATASAQFPQLGTGGRTAMAGVVYRYDGDGANRLADHYQGNLLFMEWSRDTIFAIPTKDGDVPDRGELDVPGMTKIASALYHPIDANIGPDGAVYLAEYGRGFYANANSRISRIVPGTPDAAAAQVAPPSGAPVSGIPMTPLATVLVGVLAAALLVGPQLRRRVTA